MAYSALDTNEIEENLRDLGGAKAPRHQGLLTAQTAAAPAGGTGATEGAYDTAAHRDTAIALINNNAARIEEIEGILVELGWLSAKNP